MSVYIFVVGIWLAFFTTLLLYFTILNHLSNFTAGNMLTFMVGSKQAFEVSLADVAQTQLQGKTDVYLEFHVDDTTGANEVSLYLCLFSIIF